MLTPSPTTPTYDFSIAAIQQTAGARDYLSLFNPVDSGITTIFAAIFLSSVHTSGVGSTVPDPIRGFRISAASGGLVIPASDIAKFQTGFPDPSAEVRTDPTSSTRQAPFFNSPVAIGNRAMEVHDITIPPGSPFFTLGPGEGAVIRSEAGNTETFVNLSIVWSELSS